MTKGVITKNIKVKKFKFILEIYPNLEAYQDLKWKKYIHDNNTKL